MTIRRPEELGFSSQQLVREYPAAKNLNPKQKKEIEKLASEYFSFIGKALAPPLVVDEVLKLAAEKGWTNEPSREQPFYVIGPDEKSFALVKSGSNNLRGKDDPLENGLKIIEAHIDSPCLIAKQRPLFFECDPEEKELYPGVMLDIYPSGGIQPYQWDNIPVKIIGTGIVNNKPYNKTIRGVTVGHSAHIDARSGDTPYEDSHSLEATKIFTGHSSRKELLKYLELRNEDDFFTTMWYAVPALEPLKLGPFIAAYGHDDRVCTFAAVDAILKTKKSHNINVVIGSDYEETGGSGAGGAVSKTFLDDVLRMILKTFETKLSVEELLRKSQGISADVDVSTGPQEIPYNGSLFNKRNVSRLGYGVVIHSATGIENNNNVPLNYKNFILRIAERKKIRCQLLGTSDIADNASGLPTDGFYLTNRGLYSIDAGPTILSSHGLAELVHVADLYWARELYREFFENRAPYVEIRKKRTK